MECAPSVGINSVLDNWQPAAYDSFNFYVFKFYSISKLFESYQKQGYFNKFICLRPLHCMLLKRISENPDVFV